MTYPIEGRPCLVGDESNGNARDQDPPSLVQVQSDRNFGVLLNWCKRACRESATSVVPHIVRFKRPCA